MSTIYADAIRSLEQEVEAIEQRRGELLRAIDVMRPLASDASPSRNGNGGTRALRRTDRPTDRPTEQKVRRRAARSLPDGADVDRIVAAVRQHGGAMKPSELAKAVGVTMFWLHVRLKALQKQGLITVTGKTMSRRVSLPGTTPAKEAP